MKPEPLAGKIKKNLDFYNLIVDLFGDEEYRFLESDTEWVRIEKVKSACEFLKAQNKSSFGDFIKRIKPCVGELHPSTCDIIAVAISDLRVEVENNRKESFPDCYKEEKQYQMILERR